MALLDEAYILDVRDVPLNEPLPRSALDKSLERILATSGECNFNSFGSAL
jgi:hypothetical protein